MKGPSVDLSNLDEEMRLLAAEVEEELESAQASLHRMLTLLAWLHRQVEKPLPISDPINWPEVWPMDWPEMRECVFLDPILFDLARHQLAADLRFETERILDMSQEAGIFECAARLLLAERPRPKRGAREGYAGIQKLTRDLREAVADRNVWQVREKKLVSSDPWAFSLTDYAFSEALADRLNEHPLLSDFPDGVSAEKVRSALRG